MEQKTIKNGISKNHEVQAVNGDAPCYGKWMTIESAPTDGNSILLFNGTIGIGGYNSWERNSKGEIIGLEGIDHKDRWEWNGEGFAIEPEPTHWMPLPDVP